MNVLDILLILVIVGSLAAGLIKGLVSELISLLGVVGGIVLGLEFGPRVAGELVRWIRPAGAAEAVGFVVVFLGTLIVAAVLAWILGKVVSASPLGPGNRIAGGLFGLVRGLLLCTVAVLGLTLFLDAQSPALRDSRLAPLLGSGAELLAPLLPEKPREILERRLDQLPQRGTEPLLREDVV